MRTAAQIMDEYANLRTLVAEGRDDTGCAALLAEVLIAAVEREREPRNMANTFDTFPAAVIDLIVGENY
jgi:hypothetical protein